MNKQINIRKSCIYVLFTKKSNIKNILIRKQRNMFNQMEIFI